MIKAQEKTGMIEATKRHNLSNVGFIDGPVTELMGGNKEIYINNGRVVFYLANDYDVTVYPEDVTEWCIWDTGVYFNDNPSNSNEPQTSNYVNQFKFRFANGTYGHLKAPTMIVYTAPSDFIPIAKASDFIKRTIATKAPKKEKYAPEIGGWLNEKGEKDGLYSSDTCPVGYKPDILGFRRVKSEFENQNFVQIANAWSLFEGEDASLKEKYGNEKMFEDGLIKVQDVIDAIYGSKNVVPEEINKRKDDKIQYIWCKASRESHNIKGNIGDLAKVIAGDLKGKIGGLFGKKKK